jgi:DNA-binding MarR family transcriptional regulator
MREQQRQHQADPEFVECRGCVGAALRRASRAMTQHYERAFRGVGLRATQFSLLAMLTQTGPLPVSKLASHLGLERTTLTRNLGLLEERGLVRLRVDPADQRVRHVELTRAGHEAARKGLAAWRAAQAGVPAVLRRAHLNSHLVKLLNESAK